MIDPLSVIEDWGLGYHAGRALELMKAGDLAGAAVLLERGSHVFSASSAVDLEGTGFDGSGINRVLGLPGPRGPRGARESREPREARGETARGTSGTAAIMGTRRNRKAAGKAYMQRVCVVCERKRGVRAFRSGEVVCRECEKAGKEKNQRQDAAATLGGGMTGLGALGVYGAPDGLDDVLCGDAATLADELGKRFGSEDDWAAWCEAYVEDRIDSEGRVLPRGARGASGSA